MKISAPSSVMSPRPLDQVLAKTRPSRTVRRAAPAAVGWPPRPLAAQVESAIVRYGSPANLATAVGVSSPSVIEDWATGRRVPQRRWIPKLAEAAAVPVRLMEALRADGIAPSASDAGGVAGNALGDMIAAARVASGLSVEGLATATGARESAINDWEAGRALPQLRWLPALAGACSLHADELRAARADLIKARRSAPCRGNREPSAPPSAWRALSDLLRASPTSDGRAPFPAAVMRAFEEGTVVPSVTDLPALAVHHQVPLQALRDAHRRAEDRSGHAPDELAVRLRAAADGITAGGLAAATGVTDATARRWLDGMSAPGLRHLCDLATTLRVPLRWLWCAHPQRPAAPDAPSFAGLLIELRGQAGLSQSALAGLVGVDVSVARAWERGTEPRRSRIAAISQVLRVEPAVFEYGLVEAVEPPEGAGTTVGLTVSTLRAAAGVPRAKLAAAVGVTTNTVVRWERNQAAVPQHRLGSIAARLGADVRTLAELVAPGDDLAAVLLRARVVNGQSRRQVAAALSVHPNAVYSWERGTSRPSAAHLGRLSDVLGIDAADLLGRHDHFEITRPAAELGTDIAAARARLGFTQRELARHLGVFWRTLGHWETGRSAPGPHHAAVIRALIEDPASAVAAS